MKVRELVDLLSKVKNQDLEVFSVQNYYGDVLAAALAPSSVETLTDGGIEFEGFVINCVREDVYEIVNLNAPYRE
jgi:hypothetical protein